MSSNLLVTLAYVICALCRYVQFYGLSEPVDDIHYFLTHIAKQRSLVLKLRSPNGL